jgi:hypothetical protein
MRQLDALFRQAGFGESRERPLPPSPLTLVLAQA